MDEEAIPAPVEDTAAGTAEFRLDNELLGSTTFSTIQDVEKQVLKLYGEKLPISFVHYSRLPLIN